LRRIGDEVERIGAAGVLGFRSVVEIGNARLGIEHHVFQHGAEPVRGGIDLRLRLGGEPDGLGVAAAFEIEDALRSPAVLTVAERTPCRLGSALNDGRSTMVSVGTKFLSSAASGRINKLRMNSESQAYSVKTRVLRR